MSKKNRIIILGVVISLIVVIVGVSYAYFSAQITGGESSTTLNVTGGTISLTVNGGNSITVSNVFPQDDPIVTKTFTITGTNTTDLVEPYTLSLVIDSISFTRANSLAYTLESTNTSSNGVIVPSVLSKTNLGRSPATIVFGTGSFTKGTDNVHTYVLKIYFVNSTTVSQNVEQGKSMSAHINVTADATGVPDGWTTASTSSLLGKIRDANTVTVPTTKMGSASSSTESVLASTIDDYGISYYFRGNVTNNYVVFANMCWRIVRVVGDGSTKLVLYNYNPNSVTNPCDTSQDGTTNAFARYSGTIYTTQFNTISADNAYIGLMYGTAGASTYAEAQANVNKSLILTNLETWYTNNLSSYSSYLSDVIWCNDKSMSSGSGYSTISTMYSGSTRLSKPSLICPADSLGGSLSKYTANDTTNGNGNLDYSIGLLTNDELTYAGQSGSTNSNYLLANADTTTQWWTLTPYDYASANSFVYSSTGGGIPSVDSVKALRPAIALNSTTQATGSGTASDPYVIQ